MRFEDVVTPEDNAERIVDTPGDVEVPEYIAMHSFKLLRENVSGLLDQSDNGTRKPKLTPVIWSQSTENLHPNTAQRHLTNASPTGRAHNCPDSTRYHPGD